MAALVRAEVDLLRHLEDRVVQVIEPGVPHDDVGEVLRSDIGEEQRRILELVEVVEAVALLQPVELLLEDPGEG